MVRPMNEPLQFPLHPGLPSPVGRRLLIIALVAGGCVFAGIEVGAMLEWAEESGTLLGLVVAAAAAAHLWMRYARAHLPDPVEVSEQGLRLPDRGKSNLYRPSSILSSELLDTELGVVLRIAVEGRVYLFRAARFVDPNAAGVLCPAIRERLMGPGQVARSRAQLVRDVEHSSRPTTTTRYAIYAVLGAYALQWVTGGIEDPMQTIRLGANVQGLVFEGQWDRLISANLLHGGLLHLFLNVAALQYLGSLLERMSGGPTVLVLLVGTGLAGQALSAWAGIGFMSVGVSAAVFGLLGALGWLNLRARADLPSLVRLPARWWALIMGLNIALPVLIPRIDSAAHAGGMIAGVLLMIGLERLPQLTRGLAYAALGLVLFGVVLTGLRYPSSEGERMTELLRAAASWDKSDAELLNMAAWEAVSRKETPAEALPMALEVAERALREKPDAPHIQDTVATALYRLGRFEEAVVGERRAIRLVREDPKKWGAHLPVLGSQLMRFLNARGATGGSNLRFALDDRTLAFQALHPGPFLAYVEVRREDGPIGLLELRSAVGKGPIRLAQPWPEGTELVTMLYETLEDPPEQPSAIFWEAHPGVGRLAGY